ncbi:hypothetical protein [Olsenella uli]|uniref:hypothetical protein n=1 Tax=Olsenella uli TaxID=133926 RepID=UPI00241E11CC|nr:hypothetical protein [Olsenella uli]
MATRNYELRIEDETLVRFSIADGAFGESVRIRDVNDAAEARMPLGLDLAGDGMIDWMAARALPQNRRFAQELCRVLGIAIGDTEGIYRVGLGLSLNDDYWVVPDGFAGRFADYNLFENPFSAALSALAYTGVAPTGLGSGLTPDLTTDGSLRKAWRIGSGGERLLYKGATPGHLPGEPLSEALASHLADRLGVDHAPYWLERWEHTTCSVCADFADVRTSYVPFAVATGLTSFAGALWAAKNLGRDCFESLADMLVLDALDCNTDRHLANFGFLRDNSTGRLLGLAPAFDNGRALFPNLADEDLDGLAAAVQATSPAFGPRTYDEQVARVLGPRQRAMLERLASDGEALGDVAEASVGRTQALSALVRERAERLQALPPVDREELFSALDEHFVRNPPEVGTVRRAAEALRGAGDRHPGPSAEDVRRAVRERARHDGYAGGDHPARSRGRM